jgi:DNA-binding transcriptional ArsR family regulator
VTTEDRIRTLKALRAIASPARIRLYEILVHDGPATTTKLAESTDLPSGSVSHHLRELHRVGLVEEVASPSGDRRERWWRAVPGGLKWSAADFVTEPGTREVAGQTHRVTADVRLSHLSKWLNTWDQNTPEWIDAALDLDFTVYLTEDELRELASDLYMTVRKWYRRAGPNSSQRKSDDRRKVYGFMYVFPADEEEDRA